VSRKQLRAAAALAAMLVLVAVGVWTWPLGDDQQPPKQPAATGSDGQPDRGRRTSEDDRAERSRRPGGALELALQDDAVFLHRRHYDRERAFRQATELGVSRLKVNALWASTLGEQAGTAAAPASPRYRWTPYDRLIEAARRHGISVELALTGPAPAWATGDGRVGPTRPSAARFGEFARAAAEHFRGRIDRYSIWNEPNYETWLAPQARAPAIYRGLYEAGYRAIKHADPTAKVLFGETAPYAQRGRAIAPLKFLRAVTCRTASYAPARPCAPLEADGYAHHPYEFSGPPERPYPGADNVTIGSLDRVTAALDRLAAAGALRTPAGKPLDLYLTEFGYFAIGKRALPDARRAEYLTRAFEIAARNPRTRQMLQYLLVSPPPGTPGGLFDTAVLTTDGRPRPSFDALAGWARRETDRGRVVRSGGQ